MRVYECIQCGRVKVSRDWAYCSNPCNDVPMVEVMSWGRYPIPPGLAAEISRFKQAKKPMKSTAVVSNQALLVDEIGNALDGTQGPGEGQ